MPEWCACSIRITGSEVALANFVETLSEPDASGQSVVFSFHQTVPSKPACDCDLHIKIWGTKWDARNPAILKQTPTELLITCDTPWSPPTEWGRRVSGLFPELDFCIAYCESGLQFYGVSKFNGYARKTVNKEYRFLEDDIVAVGNDDDGDCEPSGRLKRFMAKYSVPHM